MKIREFELEMWMNEFENKCELNLAETCVASLSVAELFDLCGMPSEAVLEEILPMRLTYGAITGSERLRNAVSALYGRQSPENVLIAHGTIGANALTLQTLVSPGDRVICVKPTYQQLYSIPESLGADVQILSLREENDFLPDLDELRSLINDRTVLITINNPNNPTGSLMDTPMLKELVEIAQIHNSWILSDEAYRGMDRDGSGFSESIADMYDRGISTSGMSKSFSLAGLRMGWIVSNRELLRSIEVHRDYNTISVGMLNDFMASLALENSAAIVGRNRHIASTNLDILDSWVTNEPLLSYVKPKSGTTALLKYDADVPSYQFCIDLLEQHGVLLSPGSVMDMEGYLRIGYANQTKILKQGLERMSDFLSNVLQSI